jgi:hypothetical protein
LINKRRFKEAKNEEKYFGAFGNGFGKAYFVNGRQ